MSTNLATAYVQIQAATQGMGRQIQRDLGGAADSAGTAAGRSSGKKFGGAFAGIVKKAGAIGAAVGIGLAAKGGINRALAIEEAQAKLKGLGNDSKAVSQIMDNALASVSGTSFGLGEAATTAAGAVAAGIKPGESLEKMLKSVANSAASAGVGMDEMGAIFNKVATSNRAQGDVLAQVNEKGIPLTATLAKQLGVTAAEVEKMASAGKIGFKEFESAMTEASGTVAEEMGKTFRGSMANLKAAGGRIGATVMTPFLEMLRVGANALIPVLDGVNKAIKPFFEGIGTRFSDFYAGITMDAATAKGIGEPLEGFVRIGFEAGQKLAGLRQGFSDFFAGLTMDSATAKSVGEPLEGMVKVGQRVREALGGVAQAVAPVISQISTAIGPLIPQIVEFATSFSPMSIIFQAIAPLLPQIAAMLGTLAVSFGQILAAVLPLAQSLMSQLMPVFMQLVASILPVVIQLVTTLVSTFAPLIVQLVEALAPILSQLATTLFPLVASAITAIVGAIMPVVNVILAVLMPVIQALLPVITNVFQAAAQIVSGVMQVISGVIQIVTGIISGNWSQVWEGIKNVFLGIWETIKGILNAAWAIIKGVITTGLAVIKGLWNGIWTAIGQIFRSVWEGIKSVGSSAISAVQGFISSGMSSISSLWTSTWNSIKSFLSGAWDAIKSSVSDGVGNVVRFFTELPGKIVGALAGLASQLGTIGTQMIQGMIDGIKGMATKVIDSVVGVAKGAIDGAKRLLGIHSPSRVFRDQVGKQISRGMAEGITADQDKAVKAIENVSKAVTKAAETMVKDETKRLQDARAKQNKLISAQNKKLGKKASNLGSLSSSAATAQARKALGKKASKKAVAARAKQLQAERRQLLKSMRNGKKDSLGSLSKADAEKLARKNLRVQLNASAKAQRELERQKKTTAGIWEFGATKGTQRLLNSLSKKGNWTRNATRQTRSATLADLAKARENMATRIESANKRLDEMVDYRNQNAERIMGELDLKPAEDKDGKKKKLSIAEVSSRVKSLAAKAKQFANKLAALGKAGIPPGLIQEIAGYGTTEGIQVADAILSGTKKQQSNLAKDWKGLEASTNRFGTVAAEQFFGVGIAAQRGLIKGLESDDKKLKKAAENLASKLTKATKKALGIHSPSRVFRDQVGAFIPAGVIAGIDRGQSELDNRVAGMVSTAPPAAQVVATAPAGAGAEGVGAGLIVQGPLVSVERMVVDSDRRVKQVAQELHARGVRNARAQGTTKIGGATK